MVFEIRDENGKKAVFKDGKQISEWFDRISENGLIKGESNFIIVAKNNKETLYEYKNNHLIKLISDAYLISEGGLIQGKSDYILVINDKKYYIYQYKDGNINKIIGNFDLLIEYGLINGESNFFLAENNDKFFIYHKLLDKPITKELIFVANIVVDKYIQNKTLAKLSLNNGKC